MKGQKCLLNSIIPVTDRKNMFPDQAWLACRGGSRESAMLLLRSRDETATAIADGAIAASKEERHAFQRGSRRATPRRCGTSSTND